MRVLAYGHMQRYNESAALSSNLIISVLPSSYTKYFLAHIIFMHRSHLVAYIHKMNE